MVGWEEGETKFNGLKHTRTHRKPKFNTINIIHKCGVIIISTDALKRTGFPPHCAVCTLRIYKRNHLKKMEMLPTVNDTTFFDQNL